LAKKRKADQSPLENLMLRLPTRKYFSLLLLATVFGCGGGGGSSTAPGSATPPVNAGNQPPPSGGTTNPPPATQLPSTGSTPAPVAAGTAMIMSCVEGAGVQCSGDRIIQIDNGVALTSSGVQAYGISTNDLVRPNNTSGSAFGLAPASGGIAEIRLTKNSAGTISDPVLLLDNFGISWDSKTERPPIIETFATSQRRVTLDANRRITVGPLPDASDIGFYDYATRRQAATQAHYANNVYFPRTNYPVRCPADTPNCRTTETDGLSIDQGDWRDGGNLPDQSYVFRLHADGDLYAGDDVPAADGTRRWLPGGDGFGVSYPGFKGYRDFGGWHYQYANLGSWTTMDTVNIIEFAGGSDEHNKNRRGMVAFGDVTDPANVPTSGTASYAGYVYGWYSRNGTEEVSFFRGDATLVVDFATRQANVTFRNAATFDDQRTPVPVAMTTAIPMGAAGANTANYMTGAVANGTLSGGLSGRYFGPVIASGSGGTGPAELGGAFTLSNASTGATAVGGFIARKQ
jgi:hypothetical protein